MCSEQLQFYTNMQFRQAREPDSVEHRCVKTANAFEPCYVLPQNCISDISLPSTVSLQDDKNTGSDPCFVLPNDPFMPDTSSETASEQESSPSFKNEHCKYFRSSMMSSARISHASSCNVECEFFHVGTPSCSEDYCSECSVSDASTAHENEGGSDSEEELIEFTVIEYEVTCPECETSYKDNTEISRDNSDSQPVVECFCPFCSHEFEILLPLPTCF